MQLEVFPAFSIRAFLIHFTFIWYNRPQHMTGMQLVNKLCSGQLTGDQVGSQYVTLIPGLTQSGTYSADTGTAG